MIGIYLSGTLVKVAGRQAAIELLLPLFEPHNQANFRMHFVAFDAIKHMYPLLLQPPAPRYIILLVEPGSQLNKAGYFFSVFCRIYERVHHSRVFSRSEERRV